MIGVGLVGYGMEDGRGGGLQCELYLGKVFILGYGLYISGDCLHIQGVLQ